MPRRRRALTIDELRASFGAWLDAIDEDADLARKLFQSTQYWIYDPTQRAFGPSKFVSYAGMDGRTYRFTRGTEIDGTHARIGAERVLQQPFVESKELRDALARWGRAALGANVFKGVDQGKWRFLEFPGQPEVLEIDASEIDAVPPVPKTRDSTSSAARRGIWRRFCEQHGIGVDPAPLFLAKGAVVEVASLGKRVEPVPVLQRSPQMESLVTREVEKVVADFEARGSQYDGLLYIMFELVDGAPSPLYVGKTEKVGNAGRLSANIARIRAGLTRHPFARWGYSQAYHLGELSRAVLRPEQGGVSRAKLAWATELFEGPGSKPRLKRPVYFWAKAWDSNTIGPWLDLGPTTLTAAEFLLIALLGGEYPQLLNADGVLNVRVDGGLGEE